MNSRQPYLTQTAKAYSYSGSPMKNDLFWVKAGNNVRTCSRAYTTSSYLYPYHLLGLGVGNRHSFSGADLSAARRDRCLTAPEHGSKRDRPYAYFCRVRKLFAGAAKPIQKGPVLSNLFPPPAFSTSS